MDPRLCQTLIHNHGRVESFGLKGHLIITDVRPLNHSSWRYQDNGKNWNDIRRQILDR